MREFSVLLIASSLLVGCQKHQQEVVSATVSQNTYLEIPDNTIVNLYDAFGEDRPGLGETVAF